MRLSNSVTGSALLGAAQGAIGCAILFAISEKYTLSKDWFLGVMIVFANATGFAAAARYGLGWFGVATAGLAGVALGGWLGVRTIGDYEYTAPTPREERVIELITPQGKRAIELSAVPAETVKRVPVGGGVGVLLGWAVGVWAYARLSRPRTEAIDETEEDGLKGAAHSPPGDGH